MTQIEVLRDEGYSCRGIAKKLGIPKSTVAYTLQRLDEIGTNMDRERSGRPRATACKIESSVHHNYEPKSMIFTTSMCQLLLYKDD